MKTIEVPEDTLRDLYAALSAAQRYHDADDLRRAARDDPGGFVDRNASPMTTMLRRQVIVIASLFEIPTAKTVQPGSERPSEAEPHSECGDQNAPA